MMSKNRITSYNVCYTKLLRVGLSFVFPTASSENLGQGKWQIGPAIALMYTGIQNLVFGAVFQNP